MIAHPFPNGYIWLMVAVHPHAKSRALERGATESEIINVIETVRFSLLNMAEQDSGRQLFIMISGRENIIMSGKLNVLQYASEKTG